MSTAALPSRTEPDGTLPVGDPLDGDPLDGEPPTTDLLESDLLASPPLHRRLPGLRTALDAQVMGGRLAALLVDPAYDVLDCRPGKISCRREGCCDLRYAVALRHRSTGAAAEVTVLGRLLPTAAAAEAYRRTRVDPLVAAVAQRLGPLRRAAAVVADLRLVLYAFPLDPALPALAAATDPRRVLAELPPAYGRGARSCAVEVVRYGRNGRCVLRYVPAGAPSCYGKLHADATGEHQQQLLAAVHPAVARELRVPRPLGYAAAIATSLCAPVPGRPADLSDPAGQVAAVQAAARAAAVLHAAPVLAAGARSLASDTAAVRAELATIRPLWPDVAAHLAAVLDELVDQARRAPEPPPVFCHGDLTPSQVLIDPGGGDGLVDFDAAARAEPALDLGRYRCYLRLALARAGSAAGAVLAEQFLAGYAEHAVPAPAGRVALHERLSLVRVAARACVQLKSGRLRTALSLLSEEAPRS